MQVLLEGYSRQALSPNTALPPYLSGISSALNYSSCPLQCLQLTAVDFRRFAFLESAPDRISLGDYSYLCILYKLLPWLYNFSIIKHQDRAAASNQWIWELVCIAKVSKTASETSALLGWIGHTQGGELLLHRVHTKVSSLLCFYSLL